MRSCWSTIPQGIIGNRQARSEDDRNNAEKRCTSTVEGGGLPVAWKRKAGIGSCKRSSGNRSEERTNYLPATTSAPPNKPESAPHYPRSRTALAAVSESPKEPTALAAAVNRPDANKRSKRAANTGQRKSSQNARHARAHHTSLQRTKHRASVDLTLRWAAFFSGWVLVALGDTSAMSWSV